MTRMVHGISKELLRAAFCDYFGVREEHADILVALYESPGEAIPTRELARRLNSHRPPTRGAVHERIRFLREILDAESLDSGGYLDGTGYQLTDLGLRECSSALRVMADALLRCGPATILANRSVEIIRLEASSDSGSLRTSIAAA